MKNSVKFVFRINELLSSNELSIRIPGPLDATLSFNSNIEFDTQVIYEKISVALNCLKIGYFPHTFFALIEQKTVEMLWREIRNELNVNEMDLRLDLFCEDGEVVSFSGDLSKKPKFLRPERKSTNDDAKNIAAHAKEVLNAQSGCEVTGVHFMGLTRDNLYSAVDFAREHGWRSEAEKSRDEQFQTGGMVKPVPFDPNNADEEEDVIYAHQAGQPCNCDQCSGGVKITVVDDLTNNPPEDLIMMPCIRVPVVADEIEAARMKSVIKPFEAPREDPKTNLLDGQDVE